MITPDVLRRREYKYLIDEELVGRIRRYIGGICAADRYADVRGRYLIDTLYLDTPRLDAYRWTVEDVHDRYKLRIRRYPGAAEGPVFFEVKRRIDESIVKTRAPYDGDWVRLLEAPDTGAMAHLPPKQRAALDRFLCFYRAGSVFPTTLVRYEREPYGSLIDEYARVTFDRSVSCQRATELSLVPEHDQWSSIDDCLSQRGFGTSAVILELKFTNVVPSWMRAMVRMLDLQRTSFCKYTRSVDAMRALPGMRVVRGGVLR